MSQKSLVLVTGVSGFLGSHVVDQLIKAGYRVRGIVRSAKVSANQEAYKVYGGAVEIIGVDDLSKGVSPSAFEGVSAVIHVAAPLAGREANAEAAIKVSVNGSLNILQQAEKAGVRNFGFASSMFALSAAWSQGDFTKLTDNQWFSITKEEVLSNKDADAMIIYIAEKVLSEQAIWEFVDGHPHVELTTVNPPFFFGPFAPGHRAPFEGPTFSPSGLSTNTMLWNLIHPNGPPPSPYFVDVRDVARALVASLKAPPTAQVGRKRIVFSSEWVQPPEIAAFVAKKRPELAHRICKAMKAEIPGIKSVVDNRRFKDVLGLDITPWQMTILDGVDALVKIEEEWKARGIIISK